jgi:hypothetical protein
LTAAWTPPPPVKPTRDWVALILAIGVATAVNLVCIGVLYAALTGQGPTGGLSENGTQLLTAALGGMIGVLGAYVGFKAGASSKSSRPRDDRPPV